jgi:hypothetical protein
MTVQELIDILKTYKPHLEVQIVVRSMDDGPFHFVIMGDRPIVIDIPVEEAE